MMAKKKLKRSGTSTLLQEYDGLLGEVVSLLETARHASARAVNAVMTATYWEIGRRIVEVEQQGMERASYGQELIQQLAADLTKRFGRGLSQASLKYMRQFYVFWPIRQMLSDETEPGSDGPIRQTLSAKSQPQQGEAYPAIERLARLFPLPWSH
jgi:hypothetical protein